MINAVGPLHALAMGGDLNHFGPIVLLVYLLIVVSKLRAEVQVRARGPERLQIKMWLCPYLIIVLFVAVIAPVGVIVDTGIQPASSEER